MHTAHRQPLRGSLGTEAFSVWHPLDIFDPIVICTIVLYCAILGFDHICGEGRLELDAYMNCIEQFAWPTTSPFLNECSSVSVFVADCRVWQQ